MHYGTKPKIVVIGGGTGTSIVLISLKNEPFNLTAIVSMADDGGSTGELRESLGVLPPGDIRQCLAALCANRNYRDLLSYRFEAGRLAGHSFGNLFLAVLEKSSGSFGRGLNLAHKIFGIEHRVVPVTFDNTSLGAAFDGGRKILGQTQVHRSNLRGLKSVFLTPKPRANKEALRALRSADFIIVGPGDIYSSLTPPFLVPGISRAVLDSRAVLVFICNLMTKAGHTDGWRVKDFVSYMEYLAGRKFDFVLYNEQIFSEDFLRFNTLKEQKPVLANAGLKSKKFRSGNFIGNGSLLHRKAHDISRNIITHDADKLKKYLVKILRT